MTNTKVLRDLIESKGVKLKFIAEQLGLSAYGFQLKLNNHREFKASEIAKLCELLDIKSMKLKEEIFFANKVD